MTVITRNIVLSEVTADATNANNPIVGYHNLVNSGSVAADTEDSDFPAVNVSNPSTAQRWQAADTKVSHQASGQLLAGLARSWLVQPVSQPFCLPAPRHSRS